MNEDEDEVALRDFVRDTGARTPAAIWIEAIAAIFLSPSARGKRVSSTGLSTN
jgi:hypothetical protein